MMAGMARSRLLRGPEAERRIEQAEPDRMRASNAP
jgi:hypothetical protein